METHKDPVPGGEALDEQAYARAHDDLRHHVEHDPHRESRQLSDVILGGQDGLVNVLGVILGVAAATGDAHVVLVAGLAAAFAEALAMAACAYTSTKAEYEKYESERERELRHVKRVPQLERQEVREIYRKKGFEEPLLSKIVETITANTDVWVAVMLHEEHQLMPVDRKAPLQSGAVVGAAALVGALLPLAPFMLVLPLGWAMAGSVLVSGVALFAMGAYKARLTAGRPLHSGGEIAVIGLVSAFLGYAVGWLLRGM